MRKTRLTAALPRFFTTAPCSGEGPAVRAAQERLRAHHPTRHTCGRAVYTAPPHAPLPVARLEDHRAPRHTHALYPTCTTRCHGFIFSPADRTRCPQHARHVYHLPRDPSRITAAPVYDVAATISAPAARS